MKVKSIVLEIFQVIIGPHFMLYNIVIRSTLSINVEGVWKKSFAQSLGENYVEEIYDNLEMKPILGTADDDGKVLEVKRSLADDNDDVQDIRSQSEENNVNTGFAQNDPSDLDSDTILNTVCRIRTVQCNNNISQFNTNPKTTEALLCQMLKSSQEKERFLCELMKQSGGSKETKKRKNVDWYIPDDYNSLEIPVVNPTIDGVLKREPLDVQLCLRIGDVQSIDESNEAVVLDMEVLVVWKDSTFAENAKKRGIKDPIYLNPEMMKKIWIPDIYFAEQKSISRPAFMGNSLMLYHLPVVGVFLYRSRIIVTLACDMDFHYYPADTQDCNITIKSFSYDASKLRMNWFAKKVGVYLYDTSDPNYQYQLTEYSEEDVNDNIEGGTAFSKLTFSIKVRRKVNYHVVQTYLPSIFFVMVTWLCFLIPSHMFEGRVVVSMSTLLTLTAMFASVRQSTPIVSYVKAIDLWMISCVFFIFAAFATFCVNAWLHNIVSVLGEKGNSEISRSTENGKMLNISGTKAMRERYERIEHFIETQPRVWLPVGFIAFNIFYWVWLFQSSAYFGWELDKRYNDIDRMDEDV